VIRCLAALSSVLLCAGAACARPSRLVLSPEPRTEATSSLAHAAGEAQTGNVEGALGTLRGAIERDPAAVRPHLRYVKAMLGLGRRAELRTFYAERAALPGATDVERTIAERLQTSGASSQLRRVYTLAAERNPESPWWRVALAEVEIAEADAWNRRRLSAIDRADHDEERHAYRQARGAVQRAQRAIEQAAAIAPRLAEVYLYRGFLRAVEGDLQASAIARTAAYRAAEASLAAATQRAPDLTEAWGALGDVRFRLGDQRGSLLAFLEAVRRAPADPALRVSLGVVLHEVDRLAEAAEQYRQAARLTNYDADPLLRLGDALADDERWEEALAAYRSALKRDGKAVEAYYKMGLLLEYLERPGEARAAYERYVDAGGARSSNVKRRIERLLRAEDK